MGDCKCVSAKVSVSGDIHATVSCDGTTHGTVSVGTVTIRDGTNEVTANGIVLLSPNGSRWLVSVDNSGNLSTSAL